MEGAENKYRIMLENMIRSMDRISNYIQGYSFKEFTSDEKTLDAVLQNLCIIGDSSKKITFLLKENNPILNYKI